MRCTAWPMARTIRARLLDKARPLAVADAKRKAEIYAGAGGAKVGRLMQLSEQGGSEPTVFPRAAYAQRAAAPRPRSRPARTA